MRCILRLVHINFNAVHNRNKDKRKKSFHASTVIRLYICDAAFYRQTDKAEYSKEQIN